MRMCKVLRMCQVLRMYKVLIRVYIVLLVVIGLWVVNGKADWIDDRNAGKVGWYGYEPLKKEKEKKKSKAEKEKKLVKQKQKEQKMEEKEKWPTPQELYTMYPEEIQKWIEKAGREAIRYPTEENVYRWFTYVQVAERKASEFAGMWFWVLQTHPELYKEAAFRSHVLTSRAALARTIKKEREKTIRSLADKYALLVFLDDSEFSDVQREALKFFENKYPSWRVEKINILERPFLAKRLNVTYAPQIWILSKKGKAVPISAGPVAFTQLEYRVFNTLLVLEGKKPKQFAPFSSYFLTHSNSNIKKFDIEKEEVIYGKIEK